MAGIKEEKKIYLVGIYCRLSKDDGTDNESASIATQKSILADYVKKQGWHIAKTYVDDGYSGTNFQRPSFQNMIKDIESGLINCVITKDLSRLGRNYLDCGLYLEVFFPEHNVRYISVNYGLDTLLYKEKCRDFMNDTTIDIVNSMLESPDIHHIFPEAYCVKQGIKRQRFNSIVNKTPILPATNRSIGGNAPSEYTKAILKKVSGLTEIELKERIESHCVDYDALINDDFDTYFVDRAKKLLGLIEKAMGKPVSDRDAEITIEQFGASLN